MPEKNQRVPENFTVGRSTTAVGGASAGGGVIVGSDDIPKVSFIIFIFYRETANGGKDTSTSRSCLALCASRRMTRFKEAIAHSIMLSSGSRVVKPCKASPGASSQRTMRKR